MNFCSTFKGRILTADKIVAESVLGDYKTFRQSFFICFECHFVSEGNVLHQNKLVHRKYEYHNQLPFILKLNDNVSYPNPNHV